MRVVKNKNSEFMKGISYAVLSAGKTSGIWSGESVNKAGCDIDYLAAKKSSESELRY